MASEGEDGMGGRKMGREEYCFMLSGGGGRVQTPLPKRCFAILVAFCNALICYYHIGNQRNVHHRYPVICDETRQCDAPHFGSQV